MTGDATDSTTIIDDAAPEHDAALEQDATLEHDAFTCITRQLAGRTI
jgi:hypothetical protein